MEGRARVDLAAVGAVLEDLVAAGRVPAGRVTETPDRDTAGLSTVPVGGITADINGIRTTAIATTAIRMGTAGMALRIFTQGGDGPTRRTRTPTPTPTPTVAGTTRVRLFGWT